MRSLIQDVRYGARRLRHDRGLSIAIVVTIALGLGLAAAVFSVAEASIFRSLGVPDADRVVRLRERTPQGQPFPFSEPDFLDYSHALSTVTRTAALKPFAPVLTGRGEPRRVEAAAVTSTLFSLVGLRPAVGRTFGADEDRDGQPAHVAVLGHAVWAQQFGSDPAALGMTIRLDGTPYQIVGVLPRDAAFPEADVLVPLGASSAADRTDKWLDVIARLAPGATPGSVRAEAATVAGQLARAHHESDGWSIEVSPLRDWIVGPALRQMIWIVLGAVGILLALAAANVAGLLTTRAIQRRGELGIRAALGAGRMRIVRQLLVEGLLLATAGGMLGVIVAWWTLDAVGAYVGGLLPPGHPLSIDAPVLLAMAALVGLLTIAFGLVPALQAGDTDVAVALRPANQRVTAGGRHWIARLVGVQVALAAFLAVGSALVGGSYLRLARVDPGFDPADVLTVPLTFDENAFPEAARASFFEAALPRLSALPGVVSAVATATDPFRQAGYANDVTPEERAATTPPSGFMQAGWRVVTPGFFLAMRVPLVEGRTFSTADNATGPGVVVISRALADRLWPGENAVGRRLYWGGTTGSTRTVVGVVGDIRDIRLDASPVPTLYLPYQQLPLTDMTVLVRTRHGQAGAADAVRRELAAIAPALPVPDVRPLLTNQATTLAAPRFRATVLALFCGIALIMAAVGLYAVVSFSVAQRTREVAIRVAIGARPAQVTTLFVREGLLPTIAGSAAGVIAAWAAAGVLRSLLFDTDVHDAGLFALAVALVAIVAPLATYVPARRASRLDPIAALTREQL